MIAYTTYDNLGQATEGRAYDGDQTDLVDANADGVPDLPAASQLRAYSATHYDDWGRVYRADTYSVDPNNGAVSADALTASNWFDQRGNLIKSEAPGGLVSKSRFDGLGRVVFGSVGDGGGDITWADAGDLMGDHVLEQVSYAYDDNSNLLQTTSKSRFHDAVGTGELGDFSSTTAPKARVSYAASYYDKGDRKTADVLVGTHGESSYTRPATAPSPSDPLLVTGYAYDGAGRLEDVTDPAGVVTRAAYDLLGRRVTSIEAYADGVPSDSDDRTTRYTYDGLSNMLTVTADLPAGQADQTTEYLYGVTVGGGSTLVSNDLLSEIHHADRATGAASAGRVETFTYNALGEQLTATDLNGNVHTYGYDVLGRLLTDTVTTLGADIDGSVRRVDRAFDSAGRLHTVTRYDAVAGGNIENQVLREYNGLGQLTQEYQQHDAAVNTSTSPAVAYHYSEMSGGSNHSRMTGMAYTNGRVLSYGYDAGIDDAVSRVSTLADGPTVLEALSYLGASTVVTRERPEAGIQWTLVRQPGDPATGLDDPYTGLDDLGRLVDHRWINTASGSDVTRYTFTYDRAGNRLSREDVAAGVHSAALDELFTYDGLHRLTETQRGDLNAAKDAIQAGTESFSQNWTLDALGNWSAFEEDTDGDGTPDLDQSRTHNAANEITGTSSAEGGDHWAAPTHDAAGNMTTIARPGDLTNSYEAVYNAFGQLVELKDPDTSQTLYEYEYDALGRRTREITYTSGIISSTRDFYHSAQSQVLEEYVTPAGSATQLDRQFVWAASGTGYIDSLVLQDRDSTGDGVVDERRYALSDERSSIVALVDAAGTVTQRFWYDAYGNQTVLTPVFVATVAAVDGDLKLGFQGLRQDASGLLFQRARYWHTSLGRFISMDPSGTPDGLNRYAGYHVLHGGVDPTGLYAEVDGFGDLITGHGVLTGLGLIPVIGNIADLANAAWYGIEGDWENALWSGASAIPGLGYGAAAIKAAKYGPAAAKGWYKAAKTADIAINGFSSGYDIGSGINSFRAGNTLGGALQIGVGVLGVGLNTGSALRGAKMRGNSRSFNRTSTGVGRDSDTGQTVSLAYNNLSSGAARLVNGLQKTKRMKVGSGIKADDLRQASIFMNRELGIARNRLGNLVAVRGSSRKVNFRGSDMPLVHTHPVFQSHNSHFLGDIRHARDHVEAVIDFGGNVTYFNQRGIILSPISPPINSYGFIF